MCITAVNECDLEAGLSLNKKTGSAILGMFGIVVIVITGLIVFIYAKGPLYSLILFMGVLVLGGAIMLTMIIQAEKMLELLKTILLISAGSLLLGMTIYAFTLPIQKWPVSIVTGCVSAYSFLYAKETYKEYCNLKTTPPNA